MITKIQKLSAIHNIGKFIYEFPNVVYDYKDTKIVSNSQQHGMTPAQSFVVYDYKDTKIVSNSQLAKVAKLFTNGCL